MSSSLKFTAPLTLKHCSKTLKSQFQKQTLQSKWLLTNPSSSASAVISLSHLLRVPLTSLSHCRKCSSDTKGDIKQFPRTRTFLMSPCPQGIQGDHLKKDAAYRLWYKTCSRNGRLQVFDTDPKPLFQVLQEHGLCVEEIESLQSGEKTLEHVLAEHDEFVAKVEEQQKAEKNKADSTHHMVDAPCPQDDGHVTVKLDSQHQPRIQNLDNHTCLSQSQQNVWERIFSKQSFVTLTAVHNVGWQQKRLFSTSQQDPHKKDKMAKDNSGNSLNLGEKEDLKYIPPDEAGESDKKTDAGVQQTQVQRLKWTVAEYGGTVIVFHVTISLMSLGFFYTLVSSGVDVMEILRFIGIGESLVQNKLDKLATGTGTFVMAYAVHKVFAPLRIGITVTATPFIVRYFRRIGLLKVPPKPK